MRKMMSKTNLILALVLASAFINGCANFIQPKHVSAQSGDAAQSVQDQRACEARGQVWNSKDRICADKDVKTSGDKCQPSILGIQGWQKYVEFKKDGTCDIDFDNTYTGEKRLSFIWLIVAGLLDAVMRIAALIAVGFFLYGGFKLITSQGSPENVKAGKETMKNALIGLVICIVGVTVQSIIMGILDVKV